jgi:putative ABC transport system permease protein
VIVAVAALALVGVALYDAVLHPTFRRLALRNITRRKNEALLVVLGSLLGTAIITSSFVVGDTLSSSVRNTARDRLGPIDETVLVQDVNDLPEALTRITSKPLPDSDGQLTMVSAAATVATVADSSGNRRAEPEGVVHEVDFDAARRFGGAPEDTGFENAGPTPAPGEVVLGEDLAAQIGVQPGDDVDLLLYGKTERVRVREVVPRHGVAGFHPGLTDQAMVAFVAPGTLERLAVGAPSNAVQPEGRVLVSNTGDVFTGNDVSDSMLLELQIRTAPMSGVVVNDDKNKTLDFADRLGKNFTRLFALIGSFSIVAGILLLINIFVMLGQERKPELGMLRALGFKRNHLVRTFGLEGSVYALMASISGVIVGVLLGRVLVRLTQGIFSERGRGFDLSFSVRPRSLALSFAIGLGIALFTVWATSAVIGRLNVIRAMRDIPDPPRQGRRVGGLVAATLGVVGGAFLFAIGLNASSPALALIGPATAGWCAVPLLGRLVGRRWAVTVPCALVLIYSVVAFAALQSIFKGSDVSVFFVQGIVLVGSGVALVVVNDDQFHWIGEWLSASGRGLATRLGLANPLAKRFRTALLLGMYALIVFVLVFMSVVAAVFKAQAPQLARDTGGGFDLRVDSNPTTPLSIADLEQQRDIVGAAGLTLGTADYSVDRGATTRRGTITGFDDALLSRGTPKLTSRDPAYATDADAWKAVLSSPGLVIAPSDVLSSGGNAGPSRQSIKVGDELLVIDPATGHRRPLRIVGLNGDFDISEGGAMVADATLPSLVSRSSQSRFYAAIAPGTDPTVVASQLQGDLIDNGVKADSFRQLVDDRLQGQQEFISLLEGFIALGLLIGIAGLGVVMVRAVRERRREIGMLRAMGFSARVVRSAFLVEATFVALQGIVIGAGLGLLTGYSVLTQSSTFGDESLDFTVPWAQIGGLAAVALAASLLAVLGPATQASRIKPAVALRITD